MTNADALTGKLLDVINQVQGAVSAHSADAVSLVLASTRIEGICSLLGSFGVVVISFLLAYCCKKYMKYDREAVIPFIFFSVLTILVFMSLFYPWNWIQVFDPKLYLAHEIMGKVLQ